MSKNNIDLKNNEKINILNSKEREEYSNEIKIIKRTLINNTHEVLEDTKLKRITSWRKSKKKFLNNLIYNILSLGILHLISLYYPNLYIKLYCNPWPAKECDYFLVENIYGQCTLCLKIHKKSNNNINFESEVTRDNMNPSLTNINIKSEYNISKNLTYSFIYKSVTYEYNEETNDITPVYMDLSNMTNKGILNFFSEGLKTENIVKKFKERYGLNEYHIDVNLPLLYFKNIEIPSLMIVLFIGVIEIILEDYLSFFIKSGVVFLIFIIEFINMKNNILNKYKKDYTLDGDHIIKVKRKYLLKDDNFYAEINNVDLLPGDIIYLKSNDLVPCDCLIIEGECIVNESDLTGSLNIFKKISLDNNDVQFNYKYSNINTLFHGMKIIKTFSKSNKGFISVLCINIGPNTYKANQFSNIVYFLERKKLYKDVYNFFGNRKIIIIIYMISVFVLSILLGIFFFFKFKMILYERMKSLLLKILLRNLCKSLMSVFFITNSILSLISIIRLRNENIICFDKSRFHNADKINTIIFSKLGTLCQNIFEIDSYHPVHTNYHKPFKIFIKSYKRNQCKEMNNQLLQYYKDYFDKYQNSSCNNSNINLRQELRVANLNNKLNIQSYEYTALFLECLLCCNNIEKFKSGLFGNIIEVSFFEDMKWDLKIHDYNNNTDNLNTKDLEEKNSSFSHKNKDKYYTDNNNYITIYDQKRDIFPKSYYKITESLKVDQTCQHQTLITGTNSNYFILQNKKINSNNLSDKAISKDYESSSFKINKILEDVSQSNFSSYKLRIYKKFVREGTLNSSAIVYNFMTKQLRFMIKGMPEHILDKCDQNSLPENFDKIILFYRKNGYIIIVCATKLINIYDYNDLNGLDFYMNNLTFCGFITLKNKLKEETKNSIKDLKQFNCNLIITSGDNEYNCLGVGFDSGIIENKTVFVFDKEDKNNNITIRKIYRAKNLSEVNNEENDETKTNISYDKYSKQNLKSNHKKDSTSPFNKTKEKISSNLTGSLISTTNFLKNNKTNNISNINYQNEEQNHIKGSSSPKIKFENQKEIKNNFVENRIRIKNKKLGIDSDRRILDSQINLENNKYYGNFQLNDEHSEINKNKHKENLKIKRQSKMLGYSPFTPNKKLKNKLRSESKNNEENSSFNLNKSINYKGFSELKNRYLIDIQKFKYYSGIFKDKEELIDNCIYCVSGKLFNFLYKNKKNKECRIILEKIHKFSKIYFYMSSYDKSVLVDFYREYKNDFVCKIGNCQNDYDSIISSNIGISLREPRNQNTILCHFYSSNCNILCIKKIIMEGRIFNENILLLEMCSFFCTLSINSYILCCFIRSIDAMKGQLNFLEVIFLILTILAFSGKSNNNIVLGPLVKNKKLYNFHYVVQFAGLLIIKTFSIYFLCIFYSTDELLDTSIIDEIFCSNYFILNIEHLISSIIFFNCISFYKKSPFTNFFLMMFVLALVIYIIILITLNSSNFKYDFFNITTFEYLEILNDSYGEKNRIFCFVACLIDFFGSLIYSYFVYIIFNSIAKYKLSNNEKIKNKK